MNTENYGDVLLIPNSVTADQLPTSSSRWAPRRARRRSTGSSTTSPSRASRTASPSSATPRASSTTRRLGGGRDHRAARPPRGVPRRAPGHQGQGRRDPAVHQLQGRLAARRSGTAGRGAVSGRPRRDEQARRGRRPVDRRQGHDVIDSLLYDAVEAGLTEADPTTTNWEESKRLLGTGKVATMVLGSWAIAQMQAAARRRRKRDDIGYLPVPGRRSTASSTRSSAATTRTASTSTRRTRRPRGRGSTGSPTSRATPPTRAACRR